MLREYKSSRRGESFSDHLHVSRFESAVSSFGDPMNAIDLSRPIEHHMPVFPGDPAVEVTSLATFAKDKHRKLLLKFSSHTSTHIDAPSHFMEKGKSLDQFDIAHFVGEAVVIDSRNKKEVTISEKDLASLKEGDIVFFCTGWSSHFGKENYFADYPVISEATAQRLVEKKARMVGFDSPSPDKAPYAIHPIFLGNDIMIIENLCSLESLVGKRFQCIVAPLSVKNADGAPCRVIARV